MLAHFFVPVYKSEWPEITADKLYDRINSDQPPLLIDIRSPEEYNGRDEINTYGHIPNPVSISILDLESKLEDLQPYKDKEIVTMCPGGGLSLVAVDILTKAGFTDAKSLKGGTDLWY
jgi:rhodanese-related sulfurtransferase